MAIRLIDPLYPPTPLATEKAHAIDRYLDSLESLFICLSQRELAVDQLDRYARLLQAAEQDALRRLGND